MQRKDHMLKITDILYKQLGTEEQVWVFVFFKKKQVQIRDISDSYRHLRGKYVGVERTSTPCMWITNE